MEISRADWMMGYVESYYRESLFYTAQNNAKGEELDIIHAIIEDMPNQFNPQTATWGLGLWEEMLGIGRSTEDIAERRSRVMMKLLTLQRITPISLERLIKNVAGANVDIIRNIAPYTFQVRIRDDSLDCSSGLIRRIVEDYKEAHMAFYQAYYLGQIVLKEQFYFKTIHRMAVYWFGEQGILNGGFLLDGSRLLNTEFPPYHMKVRNLFSVFNSENVYLKKINNAFAFTTKEKFPVLIIHTFTCYWWGETKHILNGKYFLDGGICLDRFFPPYKLKVFHRAALALQGLISVKAMWNTFRMENALKFEIRSLFRYKICWWEGALNGKYKLDGERNLDNGFPEYKAKVTHRGEVAAREAFSAPTVTVTHNLWYLDGAVPLDGSQTLDAYQSKEVLE